MCVVMVARTCQCVSVKLQAVGLRFILCQSVRRRDGGKETDTGTVRV